MAKKPNKKQVRFSIRLKTSFAIQAHLDEFALLKETAEDLGLSEEETKPFIDLMEAALIDSLKIIFPKDFEA